MNAIIREKLYFPHSCSFHKYSSLIAMAVLLTGSISYTGLFEQVIAHPQLALLQLVIGDVQRILAIQ